MPWRWRNKLRRERRQRSATVATRPKAALRLRKLASRKLSFISEANRLHKVMETAA